VLRRDLFLKIGSALRTGSSGIASLLLGVQRLATAGEESKLEADYAAFVQEIDRTYPFFDLKGIRADWEATKKRLGERVKDCRSDEEFLGIVIDAMKCLRDSHIGFAKLNTKLPPGPTEYYAGLSFLPATEGRVVIMSASEGLPAELKIGIVVTEIDGNNARYFLEERARAAWASGGFFSSPQRARLFEYRLPFRGPRGERHKITFDANGSNQEVTMTSEIEARGWPHTYNLPSNLVRFGNSCWYAKLQSQVAYVYLRRVDNDTKSGIAKALSECPNAKGSIIDLRGNGGGGYGSSLLDLLKKMPRPVAVLIDAGCTSAGETFARDLVHMTGAHLFGSTTAGSSSAKRLWTFPSGIATVSLPVRSRWRLDGKPIEFNGIEPDEKVESVPEEVQRRLNTEILRAEEYLSKTTKE
jgi:hypothetical protein